MKNSKMLEISSDALAVSKSELIAPRVSILINNYNYGHYLSQAIDSILNQNYSNIELVVVDDGSTDDSPKIIESYGNNIISILKENGGQASAMNAGFSSSSGDIICFLDADDLFLPEKVLYVATLFKDNPEIDWVFTESAPVNTSKIEGSDLISLFQRVREESPQLQSDKINFKDDLIKGKLPDFTPSTSNLCFSRRVLEQIFPLPEVRGLSSMAITDLYIHTLAVGLGTGYFTKKNLGIYRQHDVNRKTDLHKRRRIGAEKAIVTGYWIEKNFPEFSAISQKFVSKGFATYLRARYPKSHKADVDCRDIITSYLKKESFSMKMKTIAMITYYWIRLRFVKFV